MILVIFKKINIFNNTGPQ